jgi:NADPH:quinone reductase-like Zn-dependent oxidoreductase
MSDAVRGAMAERMGADLVLDHTNTDVVAEIRRLTDGVGVDVAIEALGTPIVPAVRPDFARFNGASVSKPEVLTMTRTLTCSTVRPWKFCRSAARSLAGVSSVTILSVAERLGSR